MIFTSTVSVLSGLRSAPEAFAASQGYVVSDGKAPTIFSSRISIDMVSALENVPGITGVSPEVFAFSSYDGTSFVVRGADLNRLNSTGPKLETLQLVPGTSLSHANSVLAGDRLLSRLGVSPPCVLPMAGSYSPRLEFASVIGHYSTGSPLDDELLVPLEMARFLSGMPKDKVSIIRVATSDPEWLAGVLSPTNARFTLFDLHTSKAEVALGENQSISVGVRNWGGKAGQVTVLFSEGAQLIEEVAVSLSQSGTTRITRDIPSDQLGERSIRISIGGDFPITLYANFSVIEPYLKLSAPSKALLGIEFNVSVTKFSGEPAGGAVVAFAGQSVVADSDGRARLSASVAGTWTAAATLSGYSQATAPVQVQDPSAFPAEFLPSIVDFSVLPETIKESESAKGVLSVANGGSAGGLFQVPVLVDSVVRMTIEVSLGGMSSETVRFDISGLPAGTHTVQAGAFSRPLVVEPWIVENPDLVQLVVRYGGSTTLSSSASIPVYQAAKISEGNVSVALAALGAISALLAALAIASVYSKEIHESRRALGVLKTVGASGRAVRRLVFPQALETGLAGAAIGVVLGILVAEGISRSGAFMVFGHTLMLETDTQLLVMVLVAAVAVSVCTALWCAMNASRQSTIASIKGLSDPGERTGPGDGPLDE